MAEKLRIENLGFKYALGGRCVLSGAELTVMAGEKILLAGTSGSGKSTLLKVISPATAPRGELTGRILLDGKDTGDYAREEIISKIACVAQNPDTQTVVDTVTGELAFGCENLGMDPAEVCRRIAWICTYFGIEELLSKKIAELSGGQKQTVCLAASIMLKPDILLLDEPTTYLDPVAAVRFLDLVDNINRDFGTTVIIAEHRVEEFADRFDRVIKIENGQIQEINAAGKRETDIFYEKVFEINKGGKASSGDAVRVKNLEFRYDKNGRNVLGGVDIRIPKGSVYALLGGNGCGKTTFLRCLTGELKSQTGKITIEGKCAAMTQNPLSMFIEETPEKDLKYFLKQLGYDKETSGQKIKEISEKLDLTEEMLKANVLDLSGGEIERAAIAKLVLAGADVMLFDEPTKGLDGPAKANLTGIMRSLAEEGYTVVFVTHDINFALATAGRAGVLSGGRILE